MTQKIMPEGKFGSDFGFDRWEYPSHYCTMSYTVTPEMPEGVLTVTDCAKSDRPKEKKHYPSCEPTAASSAVAVAVIGGADGPTTIIFGPEKQGKVRVVCSALHFSPVSDIEWRMVFHEKRAKICKFNLIDI